MKFFYITVLLAVMQTSPPVPRKAADNPAGTSGKSQGQSKTNQEPPAQSSAAVKTNETTTQNSDGSKQGNNDAEHPISISKLPTVTVATPKRDWADWGYWAFSLLLVVVGGLQIGLLWRTLSAIKRQADFMERQTVATEIAANASAKSASVARAALYLTQAADVHIEGVDIYPKSPLNSSTVITVTVKNHGPTKAKKVTNDLTLGIKGQMTRPSDPRVDIEVEIGAGQPFEIGFDPLGKNIGPESLAMILEGKTILQFWGTIRYRDVFGRGYVIECEGTYNHLGPGFYIDRNEHHEENDTHPY